MRHGKALTNASLAGFSASMAGLRSPASTSASHFLVFGQSVVAGLYREVLGSPSESISRFTTRYDVTYHRWFTHTANNLAVRGYDDPHLDCSGAAGMFFGIRQDRSCTSPPSTVGASIVTRITLFPMWLSYHTLSGSLC